MVLTLIWLNGAILFIFNELTFLLSASLFFYPTVNVVYQVLDGPSHISAFCSANLEKIRLLPNIYVLAVRLLARSERYAELGLFIMNKVWYF